MEIAAAAIEEEKDDGLPLGFREYLATVTFSKGIDWEFIKEEYCKGNPMEKGQYIKREESDLLKLFQSASKNNFEIKPGHGGKIVVKADFNDTIGFEIGHGRKKLYRLQMVFTDRFYLKNAFPIKK